MKQIIQIFFITLSIIFINTSCNILESENDKIKFKGKVVYVEHYDNSKKTELTIINIDGTNKRVIDTSEKFYIYDPSWSKDGKRILYTVAYHLLLINEDGTSKQNLDAQLAVLTPKFSPDEKFIVYNLFGATSARAVLFDISKRQVVKRLYETSESCDFGSNPWKNDNQNILLSAQITRGGNFGLYFIDINSGNIDTIITSPLRLFNRPVLSNDKMEIIYSTTYNSYYGTLNRLDINAKKNKELTFTIPNLKIFHPKYWTKDKRFLFFTIKNDSNNEFLVDLLYHDFLTGKTEHLLKNISYDCDIWLEE